MAIEAALVIATEKDVTAQAELKQAERQVAIEAEAAARVRMLALGPKWEAALATLNQLAIETVGASEGLRVSGGNETYGYGLVEIRGHADLFVGLSMHPLSGHGYVPERLRKYRTFSECLRSVCGRGPSGE